MKHVAPCWTHRLVDGGIRYWFHRPPALFGPYVRDGMTVLDLGCGTGVFTVPLAEMVGQGGRVVAVDLQQAGLDRLTERGERCGVGDRIELRRCEADDPGIADLAGRVDFALAFWMVHETPEVRHFFEQVRAALSPGGHVFMAEPIFHVSRGKVEAETAAAREAGFDVVARPRVWFSRAAVLRAK